MICAFCNAELDAGMEFAYEYECEHFTQDEAVMRLIRSDARYHGEPLPLCRSCRQSIVQNNSALASEYLVRLRDRRQLQIIGAILLVFGLICFVVIELVYYFR